MKSTFIGGNVTNFLLESLPMPRNIRTLFSFLAVLLMSAVTLSTLERWQTKREERAAYEHPTAIVMLVAYEGDHFPGMDSTGSPQGEASGSFLKVGCQDLLVPFKIPVLSSRLPSVLTALMTYDPPAGLHNAVKEKDIFVKAVEHDATGKAIILLEGHPSFGGICDTPRFMGQLEETIRPYEKRFEIRLNNSESAYRCLVDMSGRCK